MIILSCIIFEHMDSLCRKMKSIGIFTDLSPDQLCIMRNRKNNHNRVKHEGRRRDGACLHCERI